MSNRPALLLIVSIKLKEKSNFRLFFTLPMFVVLGLLDVLDDYCELATLFCPHVSYQTATGERKDVSASFRMVSGILMGSMWELAFKTGPLDLVDVDVRNKESAVKVKVLNALRQREKLI